MPSCWQPTARRGKTLFCREQPDAVLLDVMLPDGDGFSLFQKLRAVRDVPVLFFVRAGRG